MHGKHPSPIFLDHVHDRGHPPHHGWDGQLWALMREGRGEKEDRGGKEEIMDGRSVTWIIVVVVFYQEYYYDASEKEKS